MSENATCPNCGAVLDYRIGQRIVGSDLAWFRSTRCSSRDYATEEDGEGLPPDEIRRELLQKDGRWELVVADADKAARAAQVLREQLDMDLRSAAAVMKAIPGPVWSGTQVEARWLAGLLEARGVASKVQKIV